MLVMSSLKPLTRLLSISVSATAFLLPLVPISVVLTTLVKLLLKMSRKMGKKLKEPGKTLSEGSPTLAMGFYPPRAFPQPIPFGNSTPGLIGWHPWPILAPGVL